MVARYKPVPLFDSVLNDHEVDVSDRNTRNWGPVSKNNRSRRVLFSTACCRGALNNLEGEENQV